MNWKSVADSYRLPKVIYAGWLLFAISVALPITDADGVAKGLEALMWSVVGVAIFLQGLFDEGLFPGFSTSEKISVAHVAVIAFSHLFYLFGLVCIPLLNIGRCRWYASVAVINSIIISSMLVAHLVINYESTHYFFESLYYGYYVGLTGYILVAVGAVMLRKQIPSRPNSEFIERMEQ